MKNAVFILLLFSLLFAENVVSEHTTILSAVKIESESFYTPYPAEPGQYVDLWVRVRQARYAPAVVEDVVCAIEPSFPFSLDPDEQAEKYIGSLGGGQLVLLKYRLRVDANALQGDNEVSLRCKAADYDWSRMTFKIYIQTHDAILTITEFNPQPEAYLPGEMGAAKITMKNLADSQLKDISVSIDLSDPSLPFSPLNDTTERRVKKLESNESVTLQFVLEASPSAKVGVYKIPVEISYSDTLGKKYSKKTLVSLAVEAKPDLFFALESTTIIKNGTKGRVTVLSANKGLSVIKFVTVKLDESPDYTIVSTNERYVGNLDPDDTISADFEIFVKSSKKEVALPFELTYVDEFGRTHTEKRELLLQLFSDADALSMGLEEPEEMSPWLIGGVALAALFLVWQVFSFLRSLLRKK